MTTLGYYLDCDDAVCTDCYEPDKWEGFEDWEEPAPITDSEESDTPTHCVECGDMIEHALTSEGYSYVFDELKNYVQSCGVPHQGRAAVLDQWADYVEDGHGYAGHEDSVTLHLYEAIRAYDNGGSAQRTDLVSALQSILEAESN